MVERTLRRIRFVTRHYAELRDGVKRAVFVPCILGAWVTDFVQSVAAGLLIILGLAALAVALSTLAGRWMDRRFGRVRSRSEHRPRWDTTVCLVGYLAASHLDKTYGVGGGLPSMTFLAVAGYGIWLAVRLGFYGIHNLLPAAIALGFAIAFIAVTDNEALQIWQWNAMRATLLAWTAAGLIDLALLNKALPQRQQEHVDVDGS
ncbi:MAG TPA: hypothetical protein VJ813_14035 [Vicinamibacterales bacterium]|nr:hypothetical protein [Vicinamibacterales bacterium]